MTTDKVSFQALLGDIAKQFNIKKSDIWKRQFLELEGWLAQRNLCLLYTSPSPRD